MRIESKSSVVSSPQVAGRGHKVTVVSSGSALTPLTSNMNNSTSAHSSERDSLGRSSVPISPDTGTGELQLGVRHHMMHYTRSCDAGTADMDPLGGHHSTQSMTCFAADDTTLADQEVQILALSDSNISSEFARLTYAFIVVHRCFERTGVRRTARGSSARHRRLWRRARALRHSS